MSKFNQVPDYFINKIIKEIKKLKNKSLKDGLHSSNFKLSEFPLIYINDLKVKNEDINLKIFNHTIYLKIFKFYTYNFYIYSFNLNITFNPFLKRIMDIKNLINIDQLVIKIYLNSQKIFFSFFIRIYDIEKFLFRYINKNFLLPIQKFSWYNIINYKENFLYIKSKNLNYIELFDIQLEPKNYKIYIKGNFFFKKNKKKISFYNKPKEKSKKVIKIIRLNRDLSKIKKKIFFS